MKSPFKFLDSYTREDREIFFGRGQGIGTGRRAQNSETMYELEIVKPCKGIIPEDRATSCHTET
jgi:hypothetical protein